MARAAVRRSPSRILGKGPMPGFAQATRLRGRHRVDGGPPLQARFIARRDRTARAPSAPGLGERCGETGGQPGKKKSGPNGVQTLAALFGVGLPSKRKATSASRMMARSKRRADPLGDRHRRPALRPEHMRAAADALRGGVEVVSGAGRRGGYELLGLRRPQAEAVADMPWRTAV